MDNCCCGRPKSSWAPPKASWENCERRGGSVNVAAEGANIIRREAKGYAGEGERGRGSVKAEGAGAEVFAGDGCSQGASFGPMAAISRRGQAGRIYNNTRARVLLRRMCVKPADLTTHSRRRPSLAPAQRHALPEHSRSSTQPRHTPAGCAMHSPPPHNTFPAEDFLSPPHSDTPVPSTSAPPRSPDARPQAARCTPADLTTHSRRRPSPTPAQQHALPEHLRSPTQPRRTPAGCAMHSPQPSQLIPRRRPSLVPAAPRCLPLCSASGTKKRHRTVDVRCRMSRSTVVAVGHWGW